MNDGFVRYVGSLKPNETVLKLYEAILSDLRDEQNAEGRKEAEKLKERINLLLNPNSSNIKPKMKYSISLINNIDTFFQDAPVEVKIKLLSSMFPEKIEFDGKISN